ncbi:hypothetical protein THAOC_13315 [Thalassiosira oceanica]|uniref:Uncharacterized protein n=1 Tax=Thalassiosira oceanica TaxID=159749 RepID=K0SLF4_THAOC|nr:hypothetical protein THAOC_13315 [Thalassiosira oceanica]|eukprot:EJK65794.1 hypothetical protein THAOC_13315 [Thalassiosira oceanica]
MRPGAITSWLASKRPRAANACPRTPATDAVTAEAVQLLVPTTTASGPAAAAVKAAAAELAAVALDMRRPSTYRAADTVQLLPPELPPLLMHQVPSRCRRCRAAAPHDKNRLLPPELPPPLGFKCPRDAEVVEPLPLLISSCRSRRTRDDSTVELLAPSWLLRRPSTYKAADTVQPLLPPELPPPLGFKCPRDAEVVEPLLLLISSCRSRASCCRIRDDSNVERCSEMAAVALDMKWPST